MSCICPSGNPVEYVRETKKYRCLKCNEPIDTRQTLSPSRLTIGERSQIGAIKRHLATIEYNSTSATYIHRLLRIIERLDSQ